MRLFISNRKFVLAFLLVLIIFALPSSVVAAEEIIDYSVDIKINQDSSIDVSERIKYDFGKQNKHGIYRDIPLSDSNNFFAKQIELSNVSVTDGGGNARPFKLKREGDNKRIKIGNPDKTITGEQVYKINYRANWALNFFEEYDELYWNAIGTGWKVPIQQAEVSVELPEGIARGDLTLKCFVGEKNSRSKCSSTKVAGADNVRQISFAHDQSLDPKTAFTVVVGFPKGVVDQPSQQSKIVKVIKDNWLLGMPIVALLILLILWFFFGRDPEGKGNVIAQYEPPGGLTPVEMGMLVDEKIDNHDLTAQIIHLANQGFLEIKYEKEEGLLFDDKKFILVKNKNSEQADNKFDRKLLNFLFSDNDKVELSKLKDKQNNIKEIKKDISQKLTENGYYKHSPKSVRGWFYVIGFMIGFIPIVVFQTVLAMISSLVTVIIVVSFGHHMVRKTKKGAVLEENILGFKEYLSVAEKDRIKFENAPEKKPKTFEKFLPYVIAFEVEQEWGQIFDDIYEGQPSWYHGTAGTYSATALAGEMGDFDSAMDSTALASSSSGVSGGSAGGGAGGGGGGSW